MYKYLILFSLSIGIHYPLYAQLQTITGNVQVVQPYCGGARPTPEIEKNARKPNPFVGKLFYIRKGKTNSIKAKIIDSFIADAQGNFSIKIPKGTYSIIVQEQKNALNIKKYNTQFQKADSVCLKKWWSTPYHLLIVKTVNEPLQFMFTNRCYIQSDAPCLYYNGPVHP
jgi:hypothetical protein